MNSVNTEKNKKIYTQGSGEYNLGTQQRIGKDDLETRLYKRILKGKRREKEIEDFSEAIKTTCELIFKIKKARKEPQKNK